MVISWFAKLGVCLAIIGLVGFDGISIMVTHFQASDEAEAAAQAAAESYHTSRDLPTALVAAQRQLPADDRVLPGSFQVAPDGSVSLEVRKTAKSIGLDLVGATKSWPVVTESGTAAPPS